jgi:hypothetical protein
MNPPSHHKEIAKYLKEKIEGDSKVFVYRDNNDSNPIPVGEFGSGKSRFYSTIGMCDLGLNLPAGDYEFAACGKLDWLPNSLASSIYWLKERAISEWPMYCEDVVKHNAKSTYRHMAYIPSTHSLEVSSGQNIQWLLGVPITDKELDLPAVELITKAKACYPGWLFNESA